MSSDKLKLDHEVKYTQPDFEHHFTQRLKMDDWKNNDRLNLEPHPSEYLLAFLANASYQIDGHKQEDTAVEKKLDLPEGWRLLTRCYNTKNHYQGAAFWNPSTLQVVLAHAGTDIKKYGTLIADLKAIIYNTYCSYINTAVTFANRLFFVMEKFRKTTGVSLQLSITGHSLGGWLAQVTAFTIEYLVCEGPTFTTSTSTKYHPHAVAFDSPGCEAFLLKLQKDYSLRCVKSHTHYTNLDITVYLSAPNRINTWSYHVGSIFRIFPTIDNTSVLTYTIEAHNMQGILNCFDEITGVADHVEEIEDWPHREKLIGYVEEYEAYFRSDEIDEDSRVRYKRKDYDFKRGNISIFSHTERMFLETIFTFKEIKFARLEQLKTLFALPENEELFPDFDLEENIITCKSLKVLIKRIKNLFRWFPEKVRKFGEDIKIGSSTCAMESRRYLRLLQNTDLNFKRNDGLIEFFSSNDYRLLMIFSVDTSHDSTVFSNMCDLEKTVFFNYEQLVELANYLDVVKVFNSQYKIIFIEYNQRVNATDAGLLLNELLKSSVQKIVLLIDFTNNETLLEYKKKVPTNTHVYVLFHSSLKQIAMNSYKTNTTTYKEFDNFDYSSLTSECKKRFIEKTISSFLPSSPPEMFYVNRKLFYKHVIKKYVWREHNSNDNLFVFTGIEEKEELIKFLEVPKTEIETVLNSDKIIICSETTIREMLYKENSISIHWLNIDKNEIVWYDSNNSVEVLQKYLDFKSEKSIEDNVEELLLFPSKIILIADEAGMGKTTTLKSLSYRAKELGVDAPWVIIVSLNNVQDLFLKLPEQLNIDNVCDFLLNATTFNCNNTKNKIIVSLLKTSLLKALPKKVVIMLDGFDEIRDISNSTLEDTFIYSIVKRFVIFLKQNTQTKIFITTRKHLKAKLQLDLSVFALNFAKLNENQQKLFFTQSFKYTFKQRNYPSVETHKIQNYVNTLYERAKTIFKEEIISLIGVPLQMRMLAEVMLPDKYFFTTSLANRAKCLLSIDNIYELYEKFNQAKVNMYYEKMKFKLTNVAKQWLFNHILSLHQVLGFQQVFPEDAMNILREKLDISTDDEEELNRVGLIGDFSLRFLHYTFAEFFTAKLLVGWLAENHSRYPGLEEFFLTKVLLHSRYRTLRFFLNNCLKSTVAQITFQYTDVIKKLQQYDRFKLHMNNGSTAFHLTVQEDNESIAKLLLSVKDPEDVIDFLTKWNKKARTALLLALQQKNKLWLGIFFDAFENFAESVKEKFLLTTLLSQQDNSQTCISDDLTCISDDLKSIVDRKVEAMKALQGLLLEDNVQLKKVEKYLAGFDNTTKMQLLSTPFGKELKTPLHIVCEKGNNILLNYFLSENCKPSSVDIHGDFAIHKAAVKGHLDIIKLFHQHHIDLNMQNDYYVSVFACAARNGRLEIVKYLLEKNVDFKKPDRNSISPLMHAAKGGHLEVLKILTAIDDVNKSDKFGMTALSYASRGRYLDVVKYLVENGKANVNCKDRLSGTPLVFAVKTGNLTLVNYLLKSLEIEVNVICFGNMTALDYAKRARRNDIIVELQRRGAKTYKEMSMT